MIATRVGGTRSCGCPLDCPDTCSLSVRTDGMRILDMRGSQASPYTGRCAPLQSRAILSRVRIAGVAVFRTFRKQDAFGTQSERSSSDDNGASRQCTNIETGPVSRR